MTVRAAAADTLAKGPSRIKHVSSCDDGLTAFDMAANWAQLRSGKGVTCSSTLREFIPAGPESKGSTAGNRGFACGCSHQLLRFSTGRPPLWRPAPFGRDPWRWSMLSGNWASRARQTTAAHPRCSVIRDHGGRSYRHRRSLDLPVPYRAPHGPACLPERLTYYCLGVEERSLRAYDPGASPHLRRGHREHDDRLTELGSRGIRPIGPAPYTVEGDWSRGGLSPGCGGHRGQRGSCGDNNIRSSPGGRGLTWEPWENGWGPREQEGRVAFPSNGKD